MEKNNMEKKKNLYSIPVLALKYISNFIQFITISDQLFLKNSLFNINFHHENANEF